MQFEMLPVINNESPEQKNHFIFYCDLAVNGKSTVTDAFDTLMQNAASRMEGWGQMYWKSPWCEKKNGVVIKTVDKIKYIFWASAAGKPSMLSTDNLKGFLAKSPFFIC